MTEIWMGYTDIARAKKEGRIVLSGDKRLEADLRTWLKLSAFAKVEKRVA
jgi:hypothetical protein